MNSLIQHVGEQQLAGFVLVVARLSPLFLIAPLFSSKLVSSRARTVAALALALGLEPIAMHNQVLRLDVATLGGLIVKELLVGLAFAFTISLLFNAIAVAGSFLDTLVGFSYGSLVDPLTGNQGTILSQLYSLVGVLVFITIGGDGWVVQGVAKTYGLVPLTANPRLGTLIGGAQHVFSTIFVSALELAAPVLIALVVTDAGFGVVSRVVPQLNVFAVGFPAKIIVGFLVIGASLPFASGWIESQLQTSVRAALSTLKVAHVAPAPRSLSRATA